MFIVLTEFMRFLTAKVENKMIPAIKLIHFLIHFYVTYRNYMNWGEMAESTIYACFSAF